MTVSAVKLPIIDLSSPDRLSTAKSIRQACVDYGFFYLANHGVEEELVKRAFVESRKLFSLPVDEKMKLLRKEHRGYTALYGEHLNPNPGSRGDAKESFYVGPVTGSGNKAELNQWPSPEVFPSWRPTMESYHRKVMSAGTRLISLIALALNLDENHFVKVGALDEPEGFLRLIRRMCYRKGNTPAAMRWLEHMTLSLLNPAFSTGLFTSLVLDVTFSIARELGSSGEEVYGASAHSDYGMSTLLMTDGVPGLQVCREKSREPRIWEDVPHIDGCFIVNIGDMMERWTNCLFRSTLHRVMPTGQERYSMAFFINPKPDCIVECFESYCSESCPPRFPPIRSGDYLKERFRLTFGY